MKKLLFIIFLFPLIALTQNGRGILKIDLDSTIIYMNVKEIIEFTNKNMSDTIRTLTAADTIICSGLKDLMIKDNYYTLALYKKKINDVDIPKAVEKALKNHLCTIYFNKKQVKTYSITKEHEKHKHNYYSCKDVSTNKEFLKLDMYREKYILIDNCFPKQ
jgi:hypothetical protein